MSGPGSGRRLWGIGTARTMRPHWVLCELGLDYETRPVVPRTPSMDDPGFRARSPRGKVPFYEDGEAALGESAAISLYLADRHRERVALAPEPGTPARAVHDDLALFALSELDATALYVLRRHRYLADVYGEAPTACESAVAYFHRSCGELERRLDDGRPYLLGEALQVADVMAVSCLVWARFMQIPLSGTLTAYCDRASARPACAAALRTNFPPEWMAAQAAATQNTSDGTP